MPELFKLKCTEWELSVWCNNVVARQSLLEKTLSHQGKQSEPSQIRFSKTIDVDLTVFDNGNETVEHYAQVDSIALNKPLFFENLLYQFEWVFLAPNINSAEIQHKLVNIHDAFRFTVPRNEHDLPRLYGVINTANDIGWLRLPLQYGFANSNVKSLAISVEVLPVKMDMHSDLTAMYQTIDREFPLWRFSLAEKTEQSISRSMKLGYFPLLWLAHFEQLRAKMVKGLKIISQSPHSRLQTIGRYTKADRLKGKLSSKLIETINQDFKQGHFDGRYLINKKHLSVDTPENRFIKMVVNTTKSRLADFHRKLVRFNQSPENQRLTDAFISEIYAWQLPFIQMQKQGFLNEIGEFSGLTSESLVLQQKTGYSAVYKVWQELKFYLDIFSNQASVSMKSISEIYEIWCFLELRSILVDELKFKDVIKNNASLTLRDLEYKLKDGFGGAFEFERDGIKIRLAHEPIFKSNSKHIRTYWVTQKPDILMEVTFADKKKCVWLFDAKYRIKTDVGTPETAEDGNQDFVPEDALNQMHRYRDALIKIDSENGVNDKSRPVFGAFALYPGFYNQTVEPNPYDSVIDEVGIGAFGLLPSAQNGHGNQWLINYLKTQIGLTSYPKTESLERLYVQESARIPYQGMKQVLYPDLVLTVASPNKEGRDLDYIKKIEDGTSQWYHMPFTTFEEKYKKHVAQELAYLAIGVIHESETTRKITRVWRIKNLTLKKRSELTIEQAGKLDGSDELYWLFELQPAMALSGAVDQMPRRNFPQSMKLTTLRGLNQTTGFAELPIVYKNAIAK